MKFKRQWRGRRPVAVRVMAKDTITLVLAGEVPAEDFVTALRAHLDLVQALQRDAANTSVKWMVSELSAGSAMASYIGLGAGVEQIVNAYEQVGAAMARGIAPAQAAVREAASRLTKVIGGDIKSLRMETADKDYEIYSAMPDAGTSPEAAESFGSVRGRIQSMSNHKSLRFTIYDMHTDRAVSCYLEPGSEEVMRKAWGKVAILSGFVRRNPITGEPTTVRHIGPQNIRLVQELSGGWRDAIGASRGRKGRISSDVAIRRGRDG